MIMKNYSYPYILLEKRIFLYNCYIDQKVLKCISSKQGFYQILIYKKVFWQVLSQFLLYYSLLCPFLHICHNIEKSQLLDFLHISADLQQHKDPRILFRRQLKFVDIMSNLIIISNSKWQTFTFLIQCINIFPCFAIL